MIKKSVFEDELILGMQQQLKNSEEKQPTAAKTSFEQNHCC